MSDNVLNQQNQDGDNQAVILDLLMYFDLSSLKTSDSSGKYTVNLALDSIEYNIDELEKSDKNAPEYLKILQAYAKSNPDFEKLEITNIATKEKGYSSPNGLNAAVFTDDKNNVTVAYRGTGSGEWIDNGKGLGAVDVGSQYDSEQQAEAMRYFEDVVEANGYNNGDYHITITGHSKGGNKAQYVTLMSNYADLIDVCVNYDGQGFSPEAIEQFKLYLGDKYEEYINKMYLIAADNDYVNELGVRTIRPNEHRSYYKAGCGWGLQNNHYPHVIFDPTTGGFKEQADGPGPLTDYLSHLMDEVMDLTPGERNILSEGLMSIAQCTLGKEQNIVNGEKCNWASAAIAALYLGAYIGATFDEEVGRLIIGQVSQSLGSLEKEVLTKINTVVTNITSEAKVDVAFVTTSVKQALVDINTLVEDATQDIQNFLNQVDVVVKEAICSFTNQLQKDLLEFRDNVTNKVNGAIEIVENITVKSVEEAKNIAFIALNTVEGTIVTGIKEVEDTVNQFTSEAADSLHELSDMADIIATSSAGMNSVSGKITSFAATLISEVSEVAADKVDIINVLVENQFDRVIDFIDSEMNKIKNYLSTLCNSIQENVRNFAEGLKEGIDNFADFLHSKAANMIDDIKVTVTEKVDSLTLEVKDKVNEFEYKIKAEINALTDITTACQKFINTGLDQIRNTTEKLAALSIEDCREITNELFKKIWDATNPDELSWMRKLALQKISLLFQTNNAITNFAMNGDSMYLETGSFIDGKDFSVIDLKYTQATGQVGLEFDLIPKITSLANQIVTEYNPQVKGYLEQAELKCSQLRFSSLNISQELQDCYASIERQNRSLNNFVTQLGTYKKKVEDMEEDIVTRLGTIKVDCKLS